MYAHERFTILKREVKYVNSIITVISSHFTAYFTYDRPLFGDVPATNNSEININLVQ